MVIIPRNIETVPPEAAARLLEKQWQARLSLRQNPLAYALNCKWRSSYNKQIRSRMSSV